MYGPHWNDPETGVTGERNNIESNYVTITDSKGETLTFSGSNADRLRVSLERFRKDTVGDPLCV
jgi:hypothetical protein